MTEAQLIERLERLERNNRRLKKVGAAAIAILMALGAIYATRPVPQKITAHEFDVVDGAGKVRIRLSVSEKYRDASVSILDTAGTAQAVMSTGPIGPHIDLGLRKTVRPIAGMPRGAMLPAIEIGDNPLVGPGITLSNGAPLGPSVDMGVTLKGQPNIVLIDAAGKGRASMYLSPGGSPQLSFFNEGGRTTVRLMSAANAASLEFIGSQNQKIGKYSFPVDRMQLSTWGLYFDDKDGTSAISLGGINSGIPDASLRKLTFYDGKGDERASMGISLAGAPNFELSDTQGYSLDLGVIGTVKPLTGQAQRTSAASIVMFGNDKNHHVIWQAP